MQISRIVAFWLTAAMFFAFVPNAQAEEWMLLTYNGKKPSREFIFIDKDSIDRLSPDSVKIQMAMIYEAKDFTDENGKNPAAQALADFMVMCNERVVKFEKAELQNSEGAKLGTIDGPPSSKNIEKSRMAKQVFNIACEGRWPDGVISFAHMRLSEILPFWLYHEDRAAEKED